MKITRRQLKRLIQEELSILSDGKKASKSRKKPYKGSRRGKTESQAQQMAAGIALRAVEKYGKKDAISRLTGAPKSMAKMSLKDLRKLATIRRGAEVPDSTKKGHERAALPGYVLQREGILDFLGGMLPGGYLRDVASSIQDGINDSLEAGVFDDPGYYFNVDGKRETDHISFTISPGQKRHGGHEAAIIRLGYDEMNDLYRVSFNVISKGRDSRHGTGRLTSGEVAKSIVKPFADLMKSAVGQEPNVSRESVIYYLDDIRGDVPRPATRPGESDEVSMVEDAALSSLKSLFSPRSPAAYAIVSDWVPEHGTRKMYRSFSQR